MMNKIDVLFLPLTVSRQHLFVKPYAYVVMLFHGFRSAAKTRPDFYIFDIIDRSSIAVFTGNQENCIKSGVSHSTSMVPVKGIFLLNFGFFFVMRVCACMCVCVCILEETLFHFFRRRKFCRLFSVLL